MKYVRWMCVLGGLAFAACGEFQAGDDGGSDQNEQNEQSEEQGGDAGEDNDVNSPAAQAFQSDLAEVLCSHLERCEESHGRLFRDREYCIDLYSYFVEDTQANLAAPTGTSAQISACASSLAQIECSGNPWGNTLSSGFAFWQPCYEALGWNSFFSGGENESCTFGFECESELYCAPSKSLGAQCQKCRPKLGLGALCTNSSACQSGMGCFASGDSTSSCQTILGRSCAQNSDCPGDLFGTSYFCDAGNQCRAYAEGSPCESSCGSTGLNCAAGICVQPRSLGESCTVDGMCGVYFRCHEGQCSYRPGVGESCDSEDGEGILFSGSCLAGASCEQGVCTAIPFDDSNILGLAASAGLGESCTIASCDEGLYCKYEAGGGEDICWQTSGLGVACESSSACGPGAYCNYAVEGPDLCTREPVAGEACGNGYQCDSSTAYCEDELCVAKSALGQSCGGYGQCLNDAICLGQCLGGPNNELPCGSSSDCQSEVDGASFACAGTCTAGVESSAWCAP